MSKGSRRRKTEGDANAKERNSSSAFYVAVIKIVSFQSNLVQVLRLLSVLRVNLFSLRSMLSSLRMGAQNHHRRSIRDKISNLSLRARVYMHRLAFRLRASHVRLPCLALSVGPAVLRLCTDRQPPPAFFLAILTKSFTPHVLSPRLQCKKGAVEKRMKNCYARPLVSPSLPPLIPRKAAGTPEGTWPSALCFKNRSLGGAMPAYHVCM